MLPATTGLGNFAYGNGQIQFCQTIKTVKIMGTIQKGILGGFSGKVANVVGASWRGISYMRSLPSKVRNPKTPKQMEQRTRFALAGKIVRSFLPVIRVGFSESASTGLSPYAVAMSHNINYAVKGEYPNLEVDYAKVALSKGRLHVPNDVSASSEAGKMNFTWNPEALQNASGTDRVVVAAYNPANGTALYDMVAGTRAAGNAALTLPSTWNGQEVETFALFISEDGSLVSDTAYTGKHAVVSA